MPRVLMQSHSSGPSNTIHHASSGELIDIRLFKNNLKTTAIKALFKSNHLEVSRTYCLQARTFLRTWWREK